jgi:hypothetical protein
MTLYRPAETHGSVSVWLPHYTAAVLIRPAAMKRSGLQVEDEENDPDWRADEAVVA